MDDLPTLLVSQFLSGLTRAMVYFLIASGLSLVFGAMNVLNFAHGAFYMLGAFFCYSALQWLPVTAVSFFAAVVGAALALALLGGLIESTLLRRTYALGHVPQILMTYGLALILADLVRLIWGGRFYSIGPPAYLAGVTSAGPLSLPTYHVFLILFGFFVYGTLWWLLYRTDLGRVIRASVYSREMVSALGIDQPRLFTVVFMIGIFLAGIAGGLSAPLTAIGSGMDISILIESFAIVIIGGVGNVTGTLLASLIVGEVFAFAILLPQPVPQMAQGFLFIFLIAILVVRPYGLRGSMLRL